MFLIFFHLIYTCSAFGYGKKFNICLLPGWSSTVFILLVNIFNYTFNLFINNIVRKPIIDESLLYAFDLFIKYLLEEEISLARDIRLLIIAFFISEGAFTFKVKGTGVIIRVFFVSRGSEVIVISINENI